MGGFHRLQVAILRRVTQSYVDKLSLADLPRLRGGKYCRVAKGGLLRRGEGVEDGGVIRLCRVGEGEGTACEGEVEVSQHLIITALEYIIGCSFHHCTSHRCIRKFTSSCTPQASR